VNRLGPYSRFLACTGYPQCRFVKPTGAEESSLETEDKKTDEVCEKCGLPMAVKRSRFGLFLGCSGYPACTNTKPLGGGPRENAKASDEKCEKCGEFLVIKKNRFGRTFLACPNYPKCTYAKSIKKKPAATKSEKTNS
jgi:Zn-finger domain associated with topoisomerase type I